MTTSKKSANSRKTNSTSVNSVEVGSKILRLANRRNMSASAASVKEGYGKNYVSNLNAKISSLYKSRLISREQYSEFNNLYSEYSKNR